MVTWDTDAHGAAKRLVLNQVGQHLAKTGSPRARAVLDAWKRYRPMFRKVVPHTAPATAARPAEATPAAV